ncbi:hypothetical protein MSM1_14945 [Mycobacterium sp. SM1]|uniref:hypothetical protein n=1 Tax=Mycobacterium sp. SM1 TaxID=2816243 RepID=UPI001BCD905A|nr:hypothetical protein [Mycobacterium sp. SM1]MBS4729584.1 hypothetical protein [Mycobacterium sp. SM1]
MAAPHQPDGPPRGESARSAGRAVGDRPRVLRLRLAPWDVIGTLAMLAAIALAAVMTDWVSLLFGFLAQVCTGEDCEPVPYGVNFYIYPVVWGGLGAAVAAALIGPFVSLVKGWYMSFWPVVALALVFLSALAGSALTAFSVRFWH